MEVFDWEGFRAAPLKRDPFEHVIVDGFIKSEALQRINADYPAIEDKGSFPVEDLEFGAGFQEMVDALNSDEFRAAFEEKFQLNLSGLPSTLTVRGFCGGGDGQLHVDSVSKVISILIYVNPIWDNSGGRLRLLRRKNIDDVAAEIIPASGNLVAFRRSEKSWHGHLPFSGQRRVIQFNWVVSQRDQKIVVLRHRLSAAVKGLLRRTKAS